MKAVCGSAVDKCDASAPLPFVQGRVVVSDPIQGREIMAGISRCLCLLSLLSGALPMWGCADSNPTSPVSDPYQVVTISDLHFNPLYDPSLYSDLVEADPSHWADIFQMSHVLTPTGDGTDTNYPLLVLTLGDMKQHMGASPVVLFTGDMLGPQHTGELLLRVQ